MSNRFKRLLGSFRCPFVFVKGWRVKTGRYCAANWRTLVAAQAPMRSIHSASSRLSSVREQTLKRAHLWADCLTDHLTRTLRMRSSRGWGDIVHTIQKPSGLILYGNGNEKRSNSVCARSLYPGWDGGLSSGASSGCIRRGFVFRCSKARNTAFEPCAWREKGKWRAVWGRVNERVKRWVMGGLWRCWCQKQWV